MNDELTPSRTYYTAQEISDIALAWGTRPTITDREGHVVIDLEHHDSTMQLVLGDPSEFFDRMLCRSWVIVQGAPHQFCDQWNEDPSSARSRWSTTTTACLNAIRSVS